MYTLYGTPASRAARAIWALEELGVPYDFKPAYPHSDAVRAVSPSGTVPALVDGDVTLTDSTAILFHLSDKHAKLTYPLGSAKRAEMMNAVFFAIDAMEQPVWAWSRHDFILPREMRCKDAIQPALHHDFSAALATLTRMLGDGPFITGADFTIADIIIGHTGGWAKAIGFPAPEGALAEYLTRIRARPGWRKVVAMREKK